MRRRWLLNSWVGVVSVLSLWACAAGIDDFDDDEQDATPGASSGQRVSSSGSATNGSSGEPGSGSSSGEPVDGSSSGEPVDGSSSGEPVDGSSSGEPVDGSSSGEPGDGSSSGGSSSGGSSSGGSSSGGSSSGGSSSGGAGCAPVLCSNAYQIGTIQGDLSLSGSREILNATGARSRWLSFTVREQSSWDHRIGWKLEFTPAPGAEYELYVIDSDENTCASTARRIPASQFGDFRSSWSDTWLSGDTRTVRLHIKQVGGDCPSGESWRVKITGGI